MITVYFDLDGTLIDSRNRLYNLFTAITHSTITFEEYWQLKRSQLSNEWILKNKQAFSDSQIQTFREDWMSQIELKHYLQQDELFPYTISTLLKIQSFAKLILVTGRQSFENLLWQLDSLSIRSFFTSILHTSNKIAKEDLIKANNLHFQPNDIIVGDTGIDVETGKKLGITSVAVLSGFRNRDALKKYQPDHILEGIFQLPEIINQNKFNKS
jgi:phosphoglycolate phosphatase